jgi:hypothetical protein
MEPREPVRLVSEHVVDVAQQAGAADNLLEQRDEM